jgi:AbrB family looped-hinge helix DNA binding protein
LRRGSLFARQKKLAACNIYKKLVKSTQVIAMRTTVTKRSQTVVPAEIRARYQIKGGDLLEWIDDGKSIKVIPIPRDLVAALRGSARGEGLTAKLLESRDDDRKRG